MSVTFRQVRRENVPLLIGVAGGTGSGKTMSALLLARGLAGGQPFAIVDTENGRAKHYADLFPEMRHAEIHAPFRPDKYADAIQAGAAEFPVVVVDSASHEWAGDGGCLDWHDELMGGNQAKNLSAWIQPKLAHKRMVTRLLQVPAHVVMCFRAEPKVEAIREGGHTKIVPKPSLTGLDGWIPISEKMLPYELTASFLLMADRPGFPKPIKLQEQHKPFVPLDRMLSEETGRLLAEWAKGSGLEPSGMRNERPAADAKSTVSPVAASAFSPDIISKDQLTRLHTIKTNRNVPVDEAKRIVAEVGGVTSSKLLPRDRYDAVCAALEEWQPAEPAGEPQSFADMVPEGARGGE